MSNRENETYVSDGNIHLRRLARSLLGTTWRMFLPAMVLGGAGYFIDSTLSTKPIGLVSGAFLGLAISALLIKIEVDRINRQAEIEQNSKDGSNA